MTARGSQFDGRESSLPQGLSISFRHLLPANDVEHPGAGLLDALQQWQDLDWTSAYESHVPERRAIEANRAAVDRAKDALMRHFGMEALQAFSLLVRWSRLTQTPVHTLARTLVQGIDEADPQPQKRHRLLIRWLEGRLRHADPLPWIPYDRPTGESRSHKTPLFLEGVRKTGGAGTPLTQQGVPAQSCTTRQSPSAARA